MNGCGLVHSIPVRLQRRNNTAIGGLLLRACQFGTSNARRTIEKAGKSDGTLHKYAIPMV
jgi:hypothetical protein